MEEQVSQIKFDKNFIKKLLDKLKVGNTRSIHLNALPGRRRARLDLSKLNIINDDLPSQFVESLLNNESFSFPITFDSVDLGELEEEEKKKLALLSKRLNTLVIENEDNFLEFGIKNFGVGFPLLIKRDKNDPSKIIKAPLFIWSLDIKRSFRDKNKWTIEKEEDAPIKLNELLISHLSKDESIQLGKIPKEVLEDGILDEQELLELCDNILSQLNQKNNNLKLKIETCPDKKTIESIANDKPWIQWSGVLGIYRSQKETIIHATEELLERFEEFESENLILEKFQTNTISPVETDPSKEEIINTLTNDEIKLIQGPPGTGKSQSITAIVSNTLANSGKCLIVCEKKTALDVIQKNLKEIGLGDFAVVIDDIYKDRKKVIKKARRVNEHPGNTRFSKLEFDRKYKKFCRTKENLNAKYAEGLTNVFGDFSWKRLIGLYLRFSKSQNFQKVSEKLDHKPLNFNHDEYSQLLNTVEEGSLLFEDMEIDSEDVFEPVAEDLFTQEYKWSTHKNVKEQTTKFLSTLEEANELLQDKKQNDCEVEGVSIFNQEKFTKVDTDTKQLKKHLSEISKLYKEGLKIIGDNFKKKTFFQDFFFTLLSPFSKKNKRASEIRKSISKLVGDANKEAKKLEAIGVKALSLKDFKEFEDLKSLHEDINDRLEKLSEIRKKIKKIKSFEDKLQKVEKKLENKEIEKVFTFQTKQYTEQKDFEALYSYYHEWKNKIEKIQSYLDAYESYHNWKYFETRRNNAELKVLSALKAAHTKDWKNIFKAWYYQGALLKHEENSEVGFNKSDSKLKQLSTIYQDLKDLQLKQIKSIWQKQRKSQLASMNHNFNILYNLRKNKKFSRRNSLRKIIETDFELFTSLFPVILTNPVAANALLPLKQGLFKVVIFDEASQLRIEDTFTSLIRGQYKIIAGDEHQMPPSSYFRSAAVSLDVDDEEDNDGVFTEEDEQAILAESESLLEYCRDLKNVNKSYLDFHYRSKHPALIDFSNCAFYGGNLIPFPPQEVYKPIEFRAVNGRYDSRVNQDEVLEVLKIIKDEIHPDQHGKYPSVGIATFNINQRNLITEAINEAAEKDLEFAKKAQELKEQGLFVKNLENIQGDEKDIIIISTTYGVKPDGKFSQNFARLNRIEGYKLLNVLITRAKKKLYVCTSIPKEYYLTYSDYIKNEGNNRRGILYAYLAYAEAVSNHDNDTAESILRTLKEQSYEKPRAVSQNDGLSESVFEEEVYSELLDHFKEDEVIQQHKIGGFRLDFVVNNGDQQIVLECDGKAYHQSDEAHAYDMYRQKELENMGYTVYRIWSTNWFQDKEKEIEKFLKFIKTAE